MIYACGLLLFIPCSPAFAAPHIYSFKAHPPIHVQGQAGASPTGLTPDKIKEAYHLPASGGKGTIAIVDAFHDATLDHDLNAFSRQFHLPACHAGNGCLEVHRMNGTTKSNSGWSMETSLDVEWAHAIAPQAKILLVEAASGSATNLLAAIDYARKRSDVVAVSMSWGGGEFPEETTLESHFIGAPGTVFFASSGDNGAGVSWPAVSPNVVGVGGTSLAFTTSAVKETAWDGSGGGVSAFEKQPAYQTSYAIKKAGGMRAVPDVSYDADPASGYAIYWSKTAKAKNGWYTVGGTSAGAPQWAAIQALGQSASNERLYADKSSSKSAAYFRDITSGSNGDCTYYCDAHRHYDYITGLGSPLTVEF